MEQAGQSYPAGAVDGGKLLICEIKQSVCITSNMRTTNHITTSTFQLKSTLFLKIAWKEGK